MKKILLRVIIGAIVALLLWTCGSFIAKYWLEMAIVAFAGVGVVYALVSGKNPLRSWDNQ